MNTDLLLIVAGVVVLIVGAGAVWLFLAGGEGDSPAQMDTLLASQRQVPTDPVERRATFTKADAEWDDDSNTGVLTLKKRLMFAQMKMSPASFWILVVGIGIGSGIVANLIFDWFVSVFFLGIGYIVMNFIVDFRMERRFKRFDKDYAPFLLSLVGLLKTGMNTLSALGAASEGLEKGSLVREEVDLMLERLRFGVTEERSIGTFGEDINHAEIELFVEALLLNKRLGGNLSDTLERLARQVRRRQYFRQAAVAAIGLQKGSLWVILFILASIEVFLYFMMPEVVADSFHNPTGWMVWESAMLLIIVGILWLRQVVRIRV